MRRVRDKLPGRDDKGSDTISEQAPMAGMANRRALRIYQTLMEAKDIAPAERKLVTDWQMGMGGSFYKSLIQLMGRADAENLTRMSMGFPDDVAAWVSWTHGNLAERVRALGIDV